MIILIPILLVSRRTFGREREVQEHQRRVGPNPQRVARLLSGVLMIMITSSMLRKSNQSIYLLSLLLLQQQQIFYFQRHKIFQLFYSERNSINQRDVGLFFLTYNRQAS
jgi:hypothetical protein